MIKEQLSFAYLDTICSYLGASLVSGSHTLDNAGIDAVIVYNPDDPTIPRIHIEAQLKCTSKAKMDDSMLHYRINKHLYQRLTARSAVPIYLFILALHTDVKNWIHEDEEKLISDGTMYWCDANRVESKVSAKTVLLHIPLENRVTRDSLDKLIAETMEGFM